MANGKNGQLIVVFPDRDIVVATTARQQLRFRALIDSISGAVKSESALPPNPNAIEELADAIKDAAIEKSTPVGPTPEIAAAISGKTYKFPDNALGLRSFTLDLTGPRPHFEVERYSRNSITPSFKYDVPIGLDGLYRRGSPVLSDPNLGHIPAAKGTWLNGQTFVIDEQDIGGGEQREIVLSFNGAKLNFHLTARVGEGMEASLDGEQGD
jgi:hypothetical protein